MTKEQCEELSLDILLEIRAHLMNSIDYSITQESGDIETVMLPYGYKMQEKIKNCLLKYTKE